MFTGIIEETGILLSVKGGSSGSRLVIGAGRVLEDIKRGTALPSTASALPRLPLIPAVLLRM